MAQDPDGPVLGPTMAGWLNAREETHRHLSVSEAPVDEEWVQRLANLLATEKAWQDQYTTLLALGQNDGEFPRSER
jgi:hypothetical protein